MLLKKEKKGGRERENKRVKRITKKGIDRETSNIIGRLYNAPYTT